MKIGLVLYVDSDPLVLTACSSVLGRVVRL